MSIQQLQQLTIKSGVVYRGSEPFAEIAIKVFKTLKSLNPNFMHTYFSKGSHSARINNDLVVDRRKNCNVWLKEPKDIGT